MGIESLEVIAFLCAKAAGYADGISLVADGGVCAHIKAGVINETL